MPLVVSILNCSDTMGNFKITGVVTAIFLCAASSAWSLRPQLANSPLMSVGDSLVAANYNRPENFDLDSLRAVGMPSSASFVQGDDQGTAGEKTDEKDKKPEESSGSHKSRESESEGAVEKAKKQLAATAGEKRPLRHARPVARGKSVKELTEKFQEKVDVAAREKADLESLKTKALSPRALRIQEYFNTHVADTKNLSDEELKSLKDAVLQELKSLKKLVNKKRELDEDAELRLERVSRLLAEREPLSKETKKAMEQRETMKRDWEKMKSKYAEVITELKSKGIPLTKHLE